MSTEPTTIPECPAAEHLAEFLDGGLSVEERAALERHLAGCEDCFELVAAAMAFRAEHEAFDRDDAQADDGTVAAGGFDAVQDDDRASAGPSPDGTDASETRRETSPSRDVARPLIIPHAPSVAGRPWIRPLRWRRPVFALLAAIVPVAAGLWLVLGGRRDPPVDPEAVASLAWADRLGDAAALEAAVAHAWGDSSSGLGFGGGLPATKRAFRLGVHLLDARVAQAAADEARWQDALDRVAGLLPAAPGSPAIPESSRTARDSAASGGGTSAGELLARLREGLGGSRRDHDLATLATLARRIEPASFDLGTWVEAGRLATLETAERAATAPGGEPVTTAALLTARDYRARLEELSRDSILTGEPAVARAFEQVREGLPPTSADEGQLESLTEALEELGNLF